MAPSNVKEQGHALAHDSNANMMSLESLEGWQQIFLEDEHFLSSIYSYERNIPSYEIWGGDASQGWNYEQETFTEVNACTANCAHSSSVDELAPTNRPDFEVDGVIVDDFCKKSIRSSGVQERPKLWHFCLSLLCIVLASFLISWKRSGDHLILSREGVSQISQFPQHDLHKPDSHRNTCGRKSNNFKSRSLEMAAFTSRVLMGAEWGGFGKHFCGPINGNNFAEQPVDVLDAVCAQHDYCIEKSRYLVGSQLRPLYPVGMVDDDSFQRCGIPLQSHKNPNFAARIAECDTELIDSLQNGFHCSNDPDMPKGRWCTDSRFQGRPACHEHEGRWSYPFCKAAAIFAERYHRWKVQAATAVIAANTANSAVAASATPTTLVSAAPVAPVLAAAPPSLSTAASV